MKKFSEVFSGCLPAGGFDPPIKSLKLKREENRLTVELEGSAPSPEWAGEASRRIRKDWNLSDAAVLFAGESLVSAGGASPVEGLPPPPAGGASLGERGGKPPSPGRLPAKPGEGVLFGKPSRLAVTEIGTLPCEQAKACASGRVFAVGERREHRMKLGGRWREGVSLEFFITDGTGSVCVRCAFEAEKFPPKLEKTIQNTCAAKGWITVWGEMEAYTASERKDWFLSATGAATAQSPLREDYSPEKRVELHLHTKMSEKDAVTPVAEAIAAAARWGHPAVAITDHGVCHSFPEAMAAGKKHGVKILYGVEGYLDSGSARPFHIILIARTQEGLRSLYRLVSLSHTHYFNRRPLIPKDLLAQTRSGLLVGSACERGELFSAVRNGAPEEELLKIADFYDMLEIQPLCNNRFLIREGIAKDEQQLRDWNRTVVSLGKRLGRPVCATGDVHFLDPEDEVYRAVLLSSMNMLSSDPLPLYFKTTDEMLAEFAYLGAETAREVVIEAPQSIAERCEDIRPVREGEFFPKIEGSADELRSLAYGRAHSLYGSPLPDMIAERLEKELSSIIRKGYDIIYIISQKLVQRSAAQGYPVGSRGSVGSSIAAFFAGITEVNALPPHYRCPACKYSEFPENTETSCGVDLPDKICPSCGTLTDKDGYDIPFATFLGFDADKKPDIDLNFSSEYHERAGTHLIELFGEDKVFRAGTIATIAKKNALGFALKYIEAQGLDVPNAETARLASGCEGVKLTTGQHPGGMIIVPQDREIFDFCPIHRAANKRDGKICTHFDYHAIEENLLKMDLLGHDCPTFIRQLSEMTGEEAPLNEPGAISLFSSAGALGYDKDDLIGEIGTVGIPEYGTRTTRAMLQKAAPKNFDELVRIAGLSHGEGVWRGNAETLIDSGKATLRDVICARDDITLFLVAKGIPGKLSLTISESVRKGKGLTPEWEDTMRAAKVPDWYIKSCKDIQYLFPKAHAAAYAMMSARIAWYKLHRPEAFYAVYFTLKIDHFNYELCTRDAQDIKLHVRRAEQDRTLPKSEKDKAVVAEVCYEMLRRGIQFEPLAIHTANPDRFMPAAPRRVSVPLTAIAGLGAAAAQSICEARKNGPFLAEDDISSRCRSVTKAHIESLRNAGALGGLPETAQVSLFG